MQEYGTEQTVQAPLEGRTVAEMALHGVNIFKVAYHNHLMFGSVVLHIREKYVLAEELWVYCDSSEIKLKTHIAYNSFITKTVNFAKENKLCKRIFAFHLEER